MPHLIETLGSRGWRRWLWMGLLMLASVGFTFGFACAVPFAAFGAAAAMTLDRRDALLVTAALWLLNQAIGFGLMQYPWDATTLTWGAILLAVALLSTGAAVAAGGRRSGFAAAAIAAFSGSFAVYEGSLYLVSVAVMGGVEDFEASIVLRILEINAAAFAGLLAVGALLARAMPAAGGSPKRAPAALPTR